MKFTTVHEDYRDPREQTSDLKDHSKPRRLPHRGLIRSLQTTWITVDRDGNHRSWKSPKTAMIIANLKDLSQTTKLNCRPERLPQTAKITTDRKNHLSRRKSTANCESRRKPRRTQQHKDITAILQNKHQTAKITANYEDYHRPRRLPQTTKIPTDHEFYQRPQWFSQTAKITPLDIWL